MRRALLPVSVLGAALLAGGVGWAFADREARPSVGATVLLSAGTLLCLGAGNVMIGLERRAEGLLVPDGVRLPTPHWAGPVVLVGLCDLVGGIWASPPLALVGLLLVVVAVLGWGLSLQATRDGPDRATVVVARRILAFGERHADGRERHGGGERHPGGEEPSRARIDAVLQHLGRDAVRIVVVAADGAYGDVVVRGRERAETAARLAGATVHEEFSRELGAHVRTGPFEWRRMAGSQLGGNRSAS